MFAYCDCINFKIWHFCHKNDKKCNSPVSRQIKLEEWNFQFYNAQPERLSGWGITVIFVRRAIFTFLCEAPLSNFLPKRYPTMWVTCVPKIFQIDKWESYRYLKNSKIWMYAFHPIPNITIPYVAIYRADSA